MWLFVVLLRFYFLFLLFFFHFFLHHSFLLLLFFWDICVPLRSRLLSFFPLLFCRSLSVPCLLCSFCHFSALSLISRSSYFQWSLISSMQLMLRFSSISSYFLCCQVALLLCLRGWMVFGKSHLQPHSTTPHRWVNHFKCALRAASEAFVSWYKLHILCVANANNPCFFSLSEVTLFCCCDSCSLLVKFLIVIHVINAAPAPPWKSSEIQFFACFEVKRVNKKHGLNMMYPLLLFIVMKKGKTAWLQ